MVEKGVSRDWPCEWREWDIGCLGLQREKVGWKGWGMWGWVGWRRSHLIALSKHLIFK